MKLVATMKLMFGLVYQGSIMIVEKKQLVKRKKKKKTCVIYIRNNKMYLNSWVTNLPS